MKKSEIKTLAMYLPQFHRIEENDRWWGEGYTEWTAVKEAVPLFDGHRQPRTPLNGYYYDLILKDTMIWQADLASQYGIDGFVFYHYWFPNGRLLLEKPAENLLQWNDIRMPFCFCWDPYSWKRTWSNVQGNAWSPRFDVPESGGADKGILVQQNFGEREEWERHIRYLIPFFKDDRYIRINEAPVFMFTSTMDISCFDEMMAVWKEVAKQEGIENLYIITGTDSNSGYEDAIIERMRFGKGVPEKQNNGIRCYSYDDVWKETLSKKGGGQKKRYWHGVVDYDDTPRRGHFGTVYVDATPEKFKKYYSMLVKKSMNDKNELVFIDAWNEWGEGMYLEPDSENKYNYLEKIQEVGKMSEDEFEDYLHRYEPLTQEDLTQRNAALENEITVYRKRYKMMQLWAQSRLMPKRLEVFLLKQGFNQIAIYGFGAHGRMLYDELNGGKVRIAYAIDRSRGIEHSKEIKVINPEEEFPPVDAIIVTIVEEFDNIKKELEPKTSIPVLSLRQLLDSALRN